MAKRDQNPQRADRARTRKVLEPSQRVRGELQFERRQMRPACVNRQPAPHDHHHGHHGRDLHDPHRFAAGFLDAENVLAPEICGHRDREKGGSEIRRQYNAGMRQFEQLVDQADQVLARRYSTDRAGQYVVEHQRRHRDFRQRRSHRLFDDPIDSAAREHRARFDVHRSHRVREQHYSQDEVRRRSAAGLLDDAADVVRRRGEVAQYDRGRAPERNEREHPGRYYNCLSLISKGRLRLSPLGAKSFGTGCQVFFSRAKRRNFRRCTAFNVQDADRNDSARSNCD